ncbi:MAG: DUF996 domain-containing protein [Candidatus Bathyarchaeota archaeon]|nr:DUF996 domain-containing protein [Candidatus Bathyarchaeota archaeon]
MEFNTIKTLGGVGALLMFISSLVSSAAGFAPGFIGLIGFILLIIAVHGLAKHYSTPGIFQNFLYGTLAGVVGVVALAVTAVTVILTSFEEIFYDLFPAWNGDWTSLSQYTAADINTDIAMSSIGTLLAALLIAFVIMFVFLLIVAIFYRRSLNLLRDRSEVGLFGTTGTLLLVGAVLVIVFGIGLFIVWISTLLLAIAFFQLQPKQPQPTTTTDYTPQPQY